MRISISTQTPIPKWHCVQMINFYFLLMNMSMETNKAYHFFSNIHRSLACRNYKHSQRELSETELGLSLDEEECKNSIQSSTALARCESGGSDTERVLTKEDEETFLEDLLLMETTLIALATFAPSCCKNLTGENLGSFGNLKVQVPVTLFLFPPPPTLVCLRNMIGFSLKSGVQHTFSVVLLFFFFSIFVLMF